ncbi:MAG TPA: hypothetical protein VM778_04635 [Gemmatimonadota bacterium]|nr:hypothetical protein [Gemmatimonadota bacterium]
MIFRRRRALPEGPDLERELAALVRAELLTDEERASAGGGDPCEVLDSIRILRLCALVEKRYGIEIADGEITVERFSGCGPLAEFLREKAG